MALMKVACWMWFLLFSQDRLLTAEVAELQGQIVCGRRCGESCAKLGVEGFSMPEPGFRLYTCFFFFDRLVIMAFKTQVI